MPSSTFNWGRGCVGGGQTMQWTQAKLKQVEEATVAVIYASAYGNTAALAQAIRSVYAARLSSFGISTEIFTMHRNQTLFSSVSQSYCAELQYVVRSVVHGYYDVLLLEGIH
jgi:hypothetical protein